MAFRRSSFTLVVLAALTMALPLAADQKVRCESKGSKRICRADNISSVVMMKQLSISECKEGESWGYTRDAIWVDNGCRADFQVLTRRSRDEYRERERDSGRVQQDRLVCESTGERHFCAADTSMGVKIARTMGNSECIEGRSWGFSDRGVWVDRGCRAEFVLGRERQEEWRTEVVRCESDHDHLRRCSVDTRYGVELKKQLSISDCVLNKSWGYNRDGIWVTDGCRADFLVRSR